ncbi:hypothetical protein R3P38DRAFT_3611294 [Favolaschia claudopus]|uniref:Uncharacterized protein n=1 Tax=Favolaschia claudopus TaxID=2862362 RepID=A0AAW0A722_9AGAR
MSKSTQLRKYFFAVRLLWSIFSSAARPHRHLQVHSGHFAFKASVASICSLHPPPSTTVHLHIPHPFQPPTQPTPLNPPIRTPPIPTRKLAPNKRHQPLPPLTLTPLKRLLPPALPLRHVPPPPREKLAQPLHRLAQLLHLVPVRRAQPRVAFACNYCDDRSGEHS